MRKFLCRLFKCQTVDIKQAARIVELEESNSKMRMAFEHIIRVTEGAKVDAVRNNWIRQRALSALHNDTNWVDVKKPAGLKIPPAQAVK